MAKPVKYGQFCPVSMTAEILTTRWTPVILRELMCGTTRFNELRRGVPKMSQSLLTTRLGDLVYHGIITKDDNSEYHLTEAGEALRPIIELMGLWGSKYLMHTITEDEEDVDLLFWDMRRHVEGGHFPSEDNFVIHFEVSGMSKGQKLWWLVRKGQEVDLCHRDPGYDVSLTVYGSLKSLISVWIGTRTLPAAIESEDIQLDGYSELRKSFADWFVLSPFANDKSRQRLSVNGKNYHEIASSYL